VLLPPVALPELVLVPEVLEEPVVPVPVVPVAVPELVELPDEPLELCETPPSNRWAVPPELQAARNRAVPPINGCVHPRRMRPPMPTGLYCIEDGRAREGGPGRSSGAAACAGTVPSGTGGWTTGQLDGPRG
jgi:hypothetical protein